MDGRDGNGGNNGNGSGMSMGDRHSGGGGSSSGMNQMQPNTPTGSAILDTYLQFITESAFGRYIQGIELRVIFESFTGKGFFFWGSSEGRIIDYRKNLGSSP